MIRTILSNTKTIIFVVTNMIALLRIIANVRQLQSLLHFNRSLLSPYLTKFIDDAKIELWINFSAKHCYVSIVQLLISAVLFNLIILGNAFFCIEKLDKYPKLCTSYDTLKSAFGCTSIFIIATMDQIDLFPVVFVFFFSFVANLYWKRLVDGRKCTAGFLIWLAFLLPTAALILSLSFASIFWYSRSLNQMPVSKSRSFAVETCEKLSINPDLVRIGGTRKSWCSLSILSLSLDDYERTSELGEKHLTALIVDKIGHQNKFDLIAQVLVKLAIVIKVSYVPFFITKYSQITESLGLENSIIFASSILIYATSTLLRFFNKYSNRSKVIEADIYCKANGFGSIIFEIWGALDLEENSISCDPLYESLEMDTPSLNTRSHFLD